jgi:hypothetical protein
MVEPSTCVIHSQGNVSSHPVVHRITLQFTNGVATIVPVPITHGSHGVGNVTPWHGQGSKQDALVFPQLLQEQGLDIVSSR